MLRGAIYSVLFAVVMVVFVLAALKAERGGTAQAGQPDEDLLRIEVDMAPSPERAADCLIGVTATSAVLNYDASYFCPVGHPLVWEEAETDGTEISVSGHCCTEDPLTVTVRRVGVLELELKSAHSGTPRPPEETGGADG